MNENLFSNSGAKVKILATIVFWLETAAFVILALVLGWEEPLFFIFLVAGPVVSYCSSLILYAFGELVDYTGALYGIAGVWKRTRTTENSQNNPAQKSATVQTPVPKTFSSASVGSEKKKCRACGCVQASTNRSCIECGEFLF